MLSSHALHVYIFNYKCAVVLAVCLLLLVIALFSSHVTVVISIVLLLTRSVAAVLFGS